MELLQLKYFQIVARYQHITKAANELNITQPSLSIMISRLEEELGTPLFIRKGRNIELNDIGKAFLKHINLIFSELESAKQEIQDMLGVENQRISLAATSTRFLKGVLKEFLLKYPLVTINQFINSKNIIEEQLKNGEIDFCISTPPIEGSEVEHAILKQDEIVLVVPSNHRFAGRECINLNEAASDEFILLAESHNYRAITDELCRLAGFTPRIAFEIDEELMYEIVQLGRGVALIPKSIYDIYSVTTHTMVSIKEPNPQISTALCWLKNKYLFETAQGFKQFVLNYYKE